MPKTVTTANLEETILGIGGLGDSTPEAVLDACEALIKAGQGFDQKKILEALEKVIVWAHEEDAVVAATFVSERIKDLEEAGAVDIPHRAGALVPLYLDCWENAQDLAAFFLKADEPASALAGYIEYDYAGNIERIDDMQLDKLCADIACEIVKQRPDCKDQLVYEIRKLQEGEEHDVAELVPEADREDEERKRSTITICKAVKAALERPSGAQPSGAPRSGIPTGPTPS